LKKNEYENIIEISSPFLIVYYILIEKEVICHL